jgi:hypothetical protein
MKSSLFRAGLALILFLGLTGCDRKPAEATVAGKDSMTWKLANGTEFNASINSANNPGERSWIWVDLPKGPVSYRIIGGDQPRDWRPLVKIRVSNDEKLTITPDPAGMFGDAVTLPAGTYAVEFKVGREEFSALTLRID